MKSVYLNGVNTFAPQSRHDLIDYALNHKKILVAVNAEKILHATSQSRDIINRNLGVSRWYWRSMGFTKKRF